VIWKQTWPMFTRSRARSLDSKHGAVVPINIDELRTFSAQPYRLPAVSPKALEITVVGHQVRIHRGSSEHRCRSVHCEIWPAVWKLIDTLVHLDAMSPGFWKSKHVLELGAGTGIASIGAALLGATTVATDLHTDVLARNIQANTIPGDGTVAVQYLNFAKAEELDHHTGCYDLILVSDCCYNRQMCQQLLDALVALSCPTCLISMLRTRSEDMHVRFVTGAANAGLSVELLQDADGVVVYQLMWTCSGSAVVQGSI